MKKKVNLFILVLVVGFIFIAGCSQESNVEKETDRNKEAIQTYLEKEFTGPNEELSNTLDKGAVTPELQTYMEENYRNIVADMDEMIRNNYVLVFLKDAYRNGYQLQPKNIDIQKVDDTQNDLYEYEVEVEYSKHGQTNTATVTGIINLDKSGKILLIRKMDGRELFEKLNR